jgi:uncharacterized protein YbaR (Trm112 family)
VHLLLTDRLVCPRCGPGFGLILRADELEDRWVEAGGLGCPNCREVYPIAGGVGDLRPPPRGPLAPEPDDPPGTPAAPDEEEVFRAQALLGLDGGGGELLLVGGAARFAPGLAGRLPDVRVVAGDPLPSPSRHPGEARWSRILMGHPLPFEPRRLRGVLLEGSSSRATLREAARVVASGARVVVLGADAIAGDLLMAAGLRLRLQEAGVVVAGR